MEPKISLFSMPLTLIFTSSFLELSQTNQIALRPKSRPPWNPKDLLLLSVQNLATPRHKREQLLAVYVMQMSSQCFFQHPNVDETCREQGRGYSSKLENILKKLDGISSSLEIFMGFQKRCLYSLQIRRLCCETRNRPKIGGVGSWEISEIGRYLGPDGLAESGLISSKLSRPDMLQSGDGGAIVSSSSLKGFVEMDIQHHVGLRWISVIFSKPRSWYCIRFPLIDIASSKDL